MAIKKKSFSDNEIPIFDEAVMYKRGEIWQFRMWLSNENRYLRRSLKTTSQVLAEAAAKEEFYQIKAAQSAGKPYYSLSMSAAVDLYLKYRKQSVKPGGIVIGRYSTIETHLKHWLKFIGAETKLKSLKNTTPIDYGTERSTGKRPARKTTIENEQSTVNSMLKWLYQQGHSNISKLDFAKIEHDIDDAEKNRRHMFEKDELTDIINVLEKIVSAEKSDYYINRTANPNADLTSSLNTLIVNYYLLIAIASGLRTGEQVQLKWRNIKFHTESLPLFDKGVEVARYDEEFVFITVEAKTSKVRKSRTFAIQDKDYFDALFKLQYAIRVPNKTKSEITAFSDSLIFSTDGLNKISQRSIKYHFEKALKLAEVNKKQRNLVPYSFRHNFITRHIDKGLTPISVAKMCGTSIAQIEKAYYHTTEQEMIKNALFSYTFNKDGVLIPLFGANG